MLNRMRELPLIIVVVLGLTACGGGGGDNKSSAPVNSRPNAVISVGATTGHSPFTVTFDADQSTDSDGSISSYNWDFGDGANAQSSLVNHTYTDLNIFSATLTVTDNDGATDTASVSIKVHAQVAGYYWGSISSNIGLQDTFVEVVVGTNGEMYAWDYENYDTSYWGEYDISESIASGTLNAEVWNPGLTFADGTQFGTVAFSADVLAGQSIIGSYTGVGDSGPLDVQYLPEISDAPLTLAELSGNWTNSDGLGLNETLTIASDGSLTYSDSGGCAATGQITELDVSINVYGITYDMNCPPGANSNLPNGARSGLMFVDDYWYADTWLVIAASIGNVSVNWAESRPRAVAATEKSSVATQMAGSSARLRVRNQNRR